MNTRVSLGNLKVGDHSELLGVDEIIILALMLKEVCFRA
jgi:hypothetical protein